MRPPATRRKPEPTIALINVVFLMLIFFMIAGTLAPPLDPELRLVETRELEGREPPNALIINAGGMLNHGGKIVETVETYVETLDQFAIARLVPDRRVSAIKVISVASDLRSAGAKKVMIVTEQALP